MRGNGRRDHDGRHAGSFDRIEHTRWFLVANNQIRESEWQGIVIYGATQVYAPATSNVIASNQTN